MNANEGRGAVLCSQGPLEKSYTNDKELSENQF